MPNDLIEVFMVGAAGLRSMSDCVSVLVSVHFRAVLYLVRTGEANADGRITIQRLAVVM